MSSTSSTPKSTSKGKKTKRISDDSAGSPYFEVMSPLERKFDEHLFIGLQNYDSVGCIMMLC